VGLGEGLVYCLILKENLNEFIFNGFTTQPRKGRGDKLIFLFGFDFFVFKSTPHPYPLPQVEREQEKEF
jgi:hypothetical protein